ncbi:autotransporter outer membrane beta-barrel domain-containing protein [Myroides pelagicus]|uniref:Uncharacterized protein n=1 Tax=Myroides pelagicus TaxID=270914 RepID=A0A7K1GLR1_9FLAO|nr:hypothetical protein [Myroides pelagicus]MTH29728.1 hypothetical protein [Myroides pelagicus]
MKKLILSATVAFTVLATSNIQAQQGFGTNTPDRSSAVDIVSSKRGLLIPRIDIPNLDQAAPVKNPANALMVYNTGSATAAGFYYWDASYNNGAGRWVRFVSSNSGSAVTVTAGTNVAVDKTTNGHDTDYKVSVKGGDAKGQVLVTKEVIVEGNPTYSTEWVNPQDFIKGSVEGVNGITATIEGDKVQVGLGGDLTKATEINTAAGNTLAINGLEVLDGTAGKEFDADSQNIVIMGADGILKQVTPKALLEDAIKGGTVEGKALTSKSITVDANAATSLLKDVNIEITAGEKDGQILVSTPKLDDKGQPVVENGKTVYETKWVDADKVGVEVTNGIQKITDGNTTKLGLGGALTEATTITTDATNTLAIDGLTELEKAGVTGNNVVMADANGVLKQTSAKNLIEDAIDKGKIEAKTLKGEGITVTAGVTAGTDTSVASSLLKDVTLGIDDNAITSAKIKDGEVKTSDLDTGAVTQDKLYAGTKDANGVGTPAAEGTVPVANADGTVEYKSVSTAIGQDLTTDGKIVIGDNKSGVDTLADAVLVATKLSIKEGSITTTEIAEGTIANVDLGSGVVSADKMTSYTAENGTTTPAAKGQIPVADGKGGVTYQQVTGELLNGKALTSGSISVFGGEKALLDTTNIEITGGSKDGQVLITSNVQMTDAEGNPVTDAAGNPVYVTKWVDASDLGNTVTASNGLTKTDNNIALGGTIDTNTLLAVDNTKGGSLAITGLEAPTDKKAPLENVKIGADGKLYAVTKAESTGSITINNGGNVTIEGDTNYSINQEEVVIEVTLGATDTNLALPAVSGTEGQTISVKIVNTDDKHSGYLVINDDKGAYLSEGSMPFQGWVIKSNGTKWIVVGRN